MNLKGKRIAILAENLYQEMELWVPYYRMKEEGAEVRVVGAGGPQAYAAQIGDPVPLAPPPADEHPGGFPQVIRPPGYTPVSMLRPHALDEVGRHAAPDAP